MHPKNKKTMANTYTQIHIHTVFAVQNKDTFLAECVGDCVYRFLPSDAILADCLLPKTIEIFALAFKNEQNYF